jgi:hypothetical protein
VSLLPLKASIAESCPRWLCFCSTSLCTTFITRWNHELVSASVELVGFPSLSYTAVNCFCRVSRRHANAFSGALKKNSDIFEGARWGERAHYLEESLHGRNGRPASWSVGVEVSWIASVQLSRLIGMF